MKDIEKIWSIGRDIPEDQTYDFLKLCASLFYGENKTIGDLPIDLERISAREILQTIDELHYLPSSDMGESDEVPFTTNWMQYTMYFEVQNSIDLEQTIWSNIQSSKKTFI